MLCNYLLIFNQEESSWISCNSIKSNLIQAYKLAFPDQIIELGLNNNPNNNYQIIANEIITLINKHQVSKIIFVDHEPSPGLIIEALEKILQPTVEIFIHAYGDFTYYLPYFSRIKYPNTFFIAASERQKLLIDQFTLSNSSCNLFFPINESLFSYSTIHRSNFRTKNNIADNECVILYTGRLSLQKNVEAIFAILERTINKNIHLMLVGEFDDLGGRFFGATQSIGYYYQKIQDLISRSNFKVTYQNKIDHEKLLDYYCGSDIFISPSLYHDEDFGMSPAEALSCGMTTILTDWGGFASFKEAEFLPVDLSLNGHQIDLAPAIKTIDHFDHEKESLDREHRSQKFRKKFGRSGFSQQIKNILNLKTNRFLGFKSLADKYIDNFLNCENKRIKPIQQNITSNDNIYGEIYQAYLNPIFKPIEIPYNIQWLNDSILNQNNIDIIAENSFFTPNLPHSSAIYMHPPLVFISKSNSLPQLIRSGIHFLSKSNYKAEDYLPIELAQELNSHTNFYNLKSQNNNFINHAYLIIVPGCEQPEILNQIKISIEANQLKAITFLDTSNNEKSEIDFQYIKNFLNSFQIEFIYIKWKQAISNKLQLNSGVIEINNFKLQSISYCTFFLMSQNIIKLANPINLKPTKLISSRQIAPYINLELIEILND